MIGTQQARIIGILRIEFLRDANSFLTIKQILEKYVEKYPDHKHLNYKTIATILRRLSEQKKIESKEEHNRLSYQYINIEEQETSSLLKLFVQAFGVSGLTHLVKKSQNLTLEEIEQMYQDENHE